ncbi:MAG: hypothetical protein Aurels2KO_20960 [Aureliella sp.]
MRTNVLRSQQDTALVENEPYFDSKPVSRFPQLFTPQGRLQFGRIETWTVTTNVNIANRTP